MELGAQAEGGRGERRRHEGVGRGEEIGKIRNSVRGKEWYIVVWGVVNS